MTSPRPDLDGVQQAQRLVDEAVRALRAGDAAYERCVERAAELPFNPVLEAPAGVGEAYQLLLDEVGDAYDADGSAWIAAVERVAAGPHGPALLWAVGAYAEDDAWFEPDEQRRVDALLAAAPPADHTDPDLPLAERRRHIDAALRATREFLDVFYQG